MNIKIKLFDGAKAPEYKTKGAACADCYANEDIDILLRETKLVKLGFATEENVRAEPLPRVAYEDGHIVADDEDEDWFDEEDEE